MATYGRPARRGDRGMNGRIDGSSVELSIGRVLHLGPGCVVDSVAKEVEVVERRGRGRGSGSKVFVSVAEVEWCVVGICTACGTVWCMSVARTGLHSMGSIEDEDSSESVVTMYIVASIRWFGERC